MGTAGWLQPAKTKEKSLIEALPKHEGQALRATTMDDLGQITLGHLLVFCVETTSSTNWGRGLEVVYHDFSKSCSMASSQQAGRQEEVHPH